MLASAALLMALGWWTHRSVEHSLRELRAAGLAAMLEAEVRALGIWVQNRQTDVRRLARDPERQERILANKIYRYMADTLAGSQDYMAAERLHDLASRGEFDLIVLDTPPVKNAPSSA